MDWKNVYNKICQKAKAEKRKRDGIHHYSGHHIIPRCLGGSGGTHGSFLDLNDKNIVLLTPREHYFCHLLLCKIHENDVDKRNYYKMLAALNRVVNSNGYIDPFKINSREFQRQKEEYLKLNVELQGKKVICLNTLEVFPSVNNACQQMGLKIKNHISEVCRGKALTYNGYCFMWYDDSKDENFYKEEFNKRLELSKTNKRAKALK